MSDNQKNLIISSEELSENEVASKINSDELNDQELDAVAGGGLWTFVKKTGKAFGEFVVDVLD